MHKYILISILTTIISFNLTSQTVCDFFTVATSSAQASDGQIDLRIISGNPPYTIYWSTGVHHENQSNLAAGVYTCTIVDASLTAGVFSTEVRSPGVFDWTFENTGENHTILVLESGLTNIPFDSGDVLGVFYEDGGTFKCGGYMAWDSGNFAISAWGDSGFTPEKDGFLNDEPFIFAYYDQATQRTFFLQSDFITTGFPNEGRYATNGMSGVAKVGNLTQELSTELLTYHPEIVHIYPNPFQDEIHIKLDKPGLFPITILSADGKELKEIDVKAEENITIPAGEFCSGIYHIKVNQQPAIQIIKLKHK